MFHLSAYINHYSLITRPQPSVSQTSTFPLSTIRYPSTSLHPSFLFFHFFLLFFQVFQFCLLIYLIIIFLFDSFYSLFSFPHVLLSVFFQSFLYIFLICLISVVFIFYTIFNFFLLIRSHFFNSLMVIMLYALGVLLLQIICFWRDFSFLKNYINISSMFSNTFNSKYAHMVFFQLIGFIQLKI